MKGFFKYVFASMVGFIFAYILIVIIALAIVFGTISHYAGDMFGKSDKEVVLKDGSILLIDLKSQIVDRTEDFPFAELEFFEDEQLAVELKDITDKILKAKDDPKISGILLNLSIINGASTSVGDIRLALEDFKSSGKFIWNYSDFITQKAYYLASVADKIILSPEGEFLFHGLNAEMIYLKGMFDKLEMQPTLIRAGDYKSAGEMLINDKMSDFDRQQTEAFLFPIYDRMIQHIAKSRDLDEAELKIVADSILIKTGEDAIKYKMVDDLMYIDQVYDALKEMMKKDKLNLVKLKNYYGSEESKKEKNKEYTRDKIAIIYAVGSIGFGKGDAKTIGSDGLTKTIRKARKDENIKAIVLRINSPGGNALPSDLIWREVKLAAEAKPLVVSMGALAASGGYYIACPADSILAEPNTLTGSIGVFGLHMNLQKFWNDKLGINFDRVKTGEHADLMNPNRPITPEEQQIVQSYVNEVYNDFKYRVAEGRVMDAEKVDSLARGRIWSGVDAVENGLVDRIGNLYDAIDVAANMAGLENYRIKELPKKSSPFKNIPFLSMKMYSERAVKKSLGQDYTLYKKAKEIRNMSGGIYMQMPYEFEF
ncbi:MAG: signal peptide peptidase SppA [Bacteroidetes bacterium]|nr:signal peptide peptidase SppA [Bacteroidota bacterium]